MFEIEIFGISMAQIAIQVRSVYDTTIMNDKMKQASSNSNPVPVTHDQIGDFDFYG